MELCSLGEREDPCGAIEWATNDSAMVPLISCKADMSSWLEAKYTEKEVPKRNAKPMPRLVKVI